MARKAIKQIKGMGVAGPDGPVGKVEDVYFDDHRWTVRYLMVDTAEMMPGHKSLISPVSIEPQSIEEHALRVSLTRTQLEQAPNADEYPPISRQFEEAHAKHYGYAGYWVGPYLWGELLEPRGQLPPPDAQQDRMMHEAAQRAKESNLRSAAEVVGYRIHASDGDIGHVEDFIVDETNWSITAMIVDTRNWLPGKKVLVPPSAIEDINWETRHVNVRMNRDELKHAPESS